MTHLLSIRFWLLLILFSALPQLAFAELSIQISLPQQTFERTSEIRFEYQFEASEELVISYSASSHCPTALNPLIKVETVSIKPGIPFRGQYEFGVESGEVETQECQAVIIIQQPVEKTISQAFHLVPQKVLQMKLKACLDVACQNPSTIFYLNESVFLDVGLAAPPERVRLRLVSPNGKHELISHPFSFIPKNPGTYVFKATIGATAHVPSREVITRFSVLPRKPHIADKFGAENGRENGRGHANTIGISGN